MADAGKRPRGRPKRGEAPVFGSSELRLRIFKDGEWRGAFRLEHVFWRALERSAKERGEKIGPHVRALVGALPEDANRAAALRAYAASFLAERLDAALGQRAPRLIAQAVQSCPIPCLVMDAARTIRLYNAPFMEFLTGGQPRQRLDPADAPRMTFNTPLADVVSTLRSGPGKVVECEMRATAFGRSLTARARIALLEYEAPERWTILVYAR